MQPFESNFSHIVTINVHSFAAVALGYGAWAIWPDTIHGWGFGLIAIMMTAIALSSAIRAIRTAIQLHGRARLIAAYQAQGAKPKSSHMASVETLRKAGMLDE